MGKQTTRQRNRTRLSSKKIRQLGSSFDILGRCIRPTHEILGPKKIAERAISAKERQTMRRQGMSADEKRALADLREHCDYDGLEDNQGSHNYDIDVEDVLDGSEQLEISHGGGEFQALTRELMGDF
ncbi:hypothetical protein BJ138DRAFT_1119562 [Hygrophoropsis aurantiaca]|uniref:Uncharacterized protein n=1 Tax=Hygrophoropsis aurantiaca TaxID=72124 RepID=A0ACB7ZT67_9AGAM|nr:hypothetical protein BJ138DRAFT_1119562 [Hygrophoropsis aurantiaca]